ncbi:MAG TPA: hypothetical protein VIK72_11635 [Clostridiaceae bacterium]
MKRKVAITWLCVMVIALAVGITLIFSSVTIGQSIGDNEVLKNGGAMDTIKYERIIDSNTSNFRTVGLVISLIGGIGMLLSGYALHKEL